MKNAATFTLLIASFCSSHSWVSIRAIETAPNREIACNLAEMYIEHKKQKLNTRSFLTVLSNCSSESNAAWEMKTTTGIDLVDRIADTVNQARSGIFHFLPPYVVRLKKNEIVHSDDQSKITFSDRKTMHTILCCMHALEAIQHAPEVDDSDTFLSYAELQ